MKTVDITWEHSNGGTWSGYIPSTRKGQRIRLFSISWSVERGEGWILRSELPGYRAARAVLSVEDGQRLSRVILNRFATMITGEN